MTRLRQCFSSYRVKVGVSRGHGRTGFHPQLRGPLQAWGTNSTAFVEATIHHVVGKRMAKRQPMRWSPRGVHFLLQVRTLDCLRPVSASRPTGSYAAGGPSALNIENTECNITQCPRMLPTPLVEKYPAVIPLTALVDYRKASVGDRCIGKKRQCMPLSIHFRKNMFSHFGTHVGSLFSLGINMLDSPHAIPPPVS